MLQLGFGFILGIVLGSFAKALADRSVTKRSFLGRSYCESCKKQLKWYDLFPVLSFIFLKGKCRYCKIKLPLEYLLFELLTGLLIGYLFFLKIPGNFFNLDIYQYILLGQDLILKIFIVIVLEIVFLTDLKTGLIPDRITYPSIAGLFIFLIISTITKIAIIFHSLSNNEIGRYLLPPHSDYFLRHSILSAQPLYNGVLAALILALFFGGLIFFTKGRGMGGGDFKLSIFIGLAFGIPDSLMVIMLSFILGSVVGIALLLFGKKRFGQTIPFGPFMSLAGILTVFLGSNLINWYLQTLRLI